MRLTSVRVTGRLLVRFVSASAVRIALSATLSTTQPAVALQAAVDTVAEQFAPTVSPAGQVDGNTVAARDRQAPVSGFVEPGPGWG
jgi:hypothetical protein